MANFENEASSVYVTGQSVSKTAIIAIWELVNILQRNTGKIYASRQDAVDEGQANVPPEYGRIATMEGNDLVLRGPGQVDDQLFTTYPNWGIILRIQGGDWRTGLSQAGKIFGNRDNAVAFGQANLPSSVGTILVRNGDYLELRAPGWDVDQLFTTNPFWGVFDKIPTAGLVTDSFNNSGVTRLINVAGTGDAITADLPDDLSTAVFTGDKWFAFTALSDSTAESPTITVAGQVRTLRDVDGSILQPGALQQDRTYIFRTFGFALAYLVNASFSRAEIEAPALDVRDDLEPNVGKIYFSRQAAVDSGQEAMPGSYGRVLTMEDGVLVFRGPGATDDQLFETYPNWGIIQRIDHPALAAEIESMSKGTETAGGGVDIITLDQAGTLIRAYPDGLDFRPSQRLKDRFPASGGGGETADGWATTDGRFTAQAGQHGVTAVDRFIQGSGGVRFPVALINGVTRKAIMFSGFGQSNDDVTKMGDPLFWQTPPMMHHAFMPNDMTSNLNRGGIMGWQGVTAPGFDGLVNCNEGAQGIQSYMSAAFARLNLMGEQPFRVGLIRSSAWGGNKLVGDSAGQGLWKDGAGAYTSAWANWTQDIENGYAALTAAGYEVEAIYICFTHQEADWQTPAATYMSQFAGMKDDRMALLATSFPGLSVHWFVDQASGSGLRTPTYNGGAWPVRTAIADIADSDPEVTMVMPRYWMTFGLELDGVTQEDIHHAYRARVWQGEMFAAAINEVRSGRDWACPRMSSATINGNDVVVDFTSINPLVIDPSFCKVRQDMGFTVNGGSVAVTGVRLSGQRQVTVTCAAPPVGSIAYAYRSVDAQDVLDEWPISTGAIRDSWTMPSIFDPGKTLPRAALGDIISL